MTAEALVVLAVVVWGVFFLGRRAALIDAHQASEQSRLFALLAFVAARTQGAVPCQLVEMVETLQRFSIVRDQDDLLDLLEQAEARQWIQVYTPTTPRETVTSVAYTMTNLGLTTLGLARTDWLRRPKSDPVH